MGTEGGRRARKPQQRDENRIETTLVYEILLAIPDLIVYMVLWPIHEKDFVWRLVTTMYSHNCRGRTLPTHRPLKTLGKILSHRYSSLDLAQLTLNEFALRNSLSPFLLCHIYIFRSFS